MWGTDWIWDTVSIGGLMAKRSEENGWGGVVRFDPIEELTDEDVTKSNQDLDESSEDPDTDEFDDDEDEDSEYDESDIEDEDDE